MLSLVDGRVRLWRYKIEFQEDGCQNVEYAVAKQEKERIVAAKRNAVVAVVAQSGNEWIDGLLFDTREQAIAALAMGEEEYRYYLYQNNTEVQIAQYLTDLDLRLLKQEWGL